MVRQLLRRAQVVAISSFAKACGVLTAAHSIAGPAGCHSARRWPRFLRFHVRGLAQRPGLRLADLHQRHEGTGLGDPVHHLRKLIPAVWNGINFAHRCSYGAAAICYQRPPKARIFKKFIFYSFAGMPISVRQINEFNIRNI
ncbi:MAG TPA: hypothetical protein VN280_19870 [Variovorax sp.]|nr:hypothetical protein [Variovorax sp.]